MAVIGTCGAVRLNGRLLDRETAAAASLEAIGLFSSGGADVPYIKRVKDRPDLLRVVLRPTSDKELSVRDIEPSLQPKALLAAAFMLMDFMDFDRAEPAIIGLMLIEPHEFFGLHQDLFNGRRGLLTLQGDKLVQFVDGETAGSYHIEQGGAYSMDLTDDPATSLPHSVLFGDQVGVTLYIDEH